MAGRLLALLGPPVLLAVACGGPPPAPAPSHVLLVVLDATHAAHLSCYGGPPGLTPTLDRLAASGARFDRAFAAAPWTLPSTASLMTGRTPERHGVITSSQRLPEDATTLAERFRAAGWRTGALVQMVYASDAYGLDQGFDDYHYYATAEEKQDALLVYDAGRWMEGHAGERTLLYVHLRRPHSPYDPPRSAWERLAGEPPGVDPARFPLLQHADARVQDADELRPGELETIRRLYRANLAAADATLDALLRRLPAPGDTLVVVLADHGEALGEHGAFGHGTSVWPEVLDIPLIVSGPGVRPQLSDASACTLDILPTLADACGLPPHASDGAAARAAGGEADIEGLSLWPLLARGEAPAPRPPVAVMARSEEAEPPVTAVIDGRWKLVLRADGERALYDRLEDRAERTPADAGLAGLAARLEAHARSRHTARRQALERSLPAPVLDAQRLEQLEQLGYVR
jgi:arylsulfatase A-like enzyme